MEAIIEPGSAPGETIRFEGFADEYPGMKPGDIVMVITEKDEGEDQVYERRGNELIMAMSVSLSEVSYSPVHVSFHVKMCSKSGR